MQENDTTEIPLPKHHSFINRIGHVYGRLTVIKFAGRSPKGRPVLLWECQCSCGQTLTVTGDNLCTGTTKSCGCYRRDLPLTRATHGRAHSPIYNIWNAIIGRCTNHNNCAFSSYGGRGITICQGWRDFASFYADMGDRPAQKSIDRIDNDKGYWCGKCNECTTYGRRLNCRWATRVEQNNNTRKNHIIEFNGLSLTLAQWAQKIEINQSAIQQRLANGWTVERALTTPLVPNDSSRKRQRNNPSNSESAKEPQLK
jgi:hypothetical protein